MYDIVLFGIQWSGKGTHGKFLAEICSEFAYFSSGDVFRALISHDNALKEYLAKRLWAWDLVEDSVVNSLFELYLHTVIEDKKYCLLDWYPRTIMQLAMLMTVCQRSKRRLLWIHFTLPDEVAINRMLARQRPDDTLEIIQHRIELYHTITYPTLDMFKHTYPLIEIDANQDIDAIQNQLRVLLTERKDNKIVH